MSTLVVVEEILRETATPMSVREIVERAGERLPSKSKTPDTVVARDLSMDLKKKGEASLFARTSPGSYTLRALAANVAPAVQPMNSMNSMSALPARKPPVAAPSTTAAKTVAPARVDHGAEGGGFAG
ncbi:MAG: winged helix-turn-helix domain-containing protein [Proteobacteria bacterium]|nr:winged helix-turn-helix domain-containing protein [Pseudomonadota bacterium]